MRAYDIIYRKRNGSELDKQEIEFMLKGYQNGDIADYQMSAFLMAVFLKGMTDEETAYLTSAMVYSGDVLDLSFLGVPVVDKHSTGGIGDGTSLILAPIVAACGICVPMMSGRALGHTGGTLDKLESIPHFRTDLTKREFLQQLQEAGLAMIGQTQEIAPVDKKLYALRDVTATVESIPLICASIMSKKIAEGAQSLILDVKVGSGAFMRFYDEAKKLAEKMTAVGSSFNKSVKTFITDMDEPLGDCAGNANEIAQAIEILKGEIKNDLSYLSIELAAAMIFAAKKASDMNAARELAQKQIDSGAAIEKFRQVIRLQGGDYKVIDKPHLLALKSKFIRQVKADKTGYISKTAAREIGLACCIAGAGRLRKEDRIDPSAGIRFCKRGGDFVKEGDVIAEINSNDADKINRAALIMEDVYTISHSVTAGRKIIKETINL